jgi:hypothetical protein
VRWDTTTAACGLASTERPRDLGSVLAVGFLVVLARHHATLPARTASTKPVTVQLSESGEVWGLFANEGAPMVWISGGEFVSLS